MKQLPAAMQQSIRKFMRWQDAQLSLLGKILLLEAFKKNGIAKERLEEIQYTAFNRPYLSGEFDFNISHSGEVVLCAFSNHVRIGIDIEKIKPLDTDEFTDQFTSAELGAIRNSADPLCEFYNWWTLKESLIKADGKGLTIPLKSIDFITPLCAQIENCKWYFQTIHIQEGYCCHLASSEHIETPAVIQRYLFV
jgi:4'-phosphopantetheinyl transferase